MSRTDDLARILKKLRLSGVLVTLDLRVRQLTEENLDTEEFLYRLLNDEAERREAKQLELRVRRAAFEQVQTLETFDFQFNPEIPRARIVDLAAGHYLDRREPICLIGPTGVGKSHIAEAFGHRACRDGHSVLFVQASQMLTELRAARADNSLAKRMLRFTSPKLLILDDLGLRPLRYEEPEDLYEVLRQRHQRGSTIITSNRSVDEWAPLFGDRLLAAAALDRLLQDAHVIEMVGESYRTSLRAKAKRSRANALPASL
jgi:DNA replication protein DnaC